MQIKLYKNNKLHRIYTVIEKIKDMYFVSNGIETAKVIMKSPLVEYENNLGNKIKLELIRWNKYTTFHKNLER